MSVPKTHIAKLRQKKSRFLWSHNNNLQTSIRSISRSIRWDERKSGSTPAATLRKWMFVEEMRWKWQRQPHDINKPLLLRDNGTWYALRKKHVPRVTDIFCAKKSLLFDNVWNVPMPSSFQKQPQKPRGRERTLLGPPKKKNQADLGWLDLPLTSKRA